MRTTQIIGVGAVLAVAAGWYVFTPPGPAPVPPAAGRPRALPPDPASACLAALPPLLPGMSRAEVEDILGLPDPAQVQPVGDVNGRATYQTAYPLPLGGCARQPVPVGPQSFVAFEFDATLPGHPLINVRYSDPLF